MTDDLFTPPFGGQDDDERGTDRTDALPAHEQDPDDAVGAGVMGAGGTATDRGTGELSGDAQGGGREEDDMGGGLNEGMIAGAPAGGAQSYIPAFIDDDEEGGATPQA